MTDEQLERILKKMDLQECKPIIKDYIYYCKKPIKSRSYNEEMEPINTLLMNWNF